VNHVFGPVPSRRLGRSLGVDLVPFKTCTYDCIYCQLGSTTVKTAERNEWLDRDAVLEEIRRKLDSRPDYITLSGSGEPTLHTGLDEWMKAIRSITEIPIAVLTNGSLLWRDEVRRELRQADLVVPSLDAGDAELFRQVNRPCEAVSFERMVDGLAAFREEFPGQYWLEVLLLDGRTSNESEVEKIAAHARRVRPDRIQLNTATRPPADSLAKPVPRARLTRLARLFDPPAEVIADFSHPVRSEAASAVAADVLATLRRRPCTLPDLVAALDLHRNEVLKYLDALADRGLIQHTVRGSDVYYRAAWTENGIPDDPLSP
jgi:wyosine [tRNA(Phe)-imidazoG37] synthetase (radical SAM superfamily)